ncbi:GIY-YIG nuclease family protein [Corynebacterium guaraldiae]|uniref:GIY-YIG nuclease family protein n=1 Tax=Corynebacterium guaraldiae TaxID=3051103 RepID=UPI00117833D7|nr:GIY-YIG nuclease family protein [Corynebacterium guaraldiae]MCG7260544.1 GIY-YIG nuclease family protein [Corynebacterium aurimucosum]TRX31862.1 GIY-YIG nuclease family protein [Corynebacterium guaraldiae]TRX38391.1 GIY-YIG nuclease family protein [Corynebacterium guaraldiae]
MNEDFDAAAFAELLASDTGGLLDAPSKPKPVTSSDRLERSFLEIVEFYREHQRIPSSDTLEIAERKLGARLDGFRAAPERAAAVAHLDEFKLLAKPEIDSYEDLLANDDLDLLDDENDIFDTSSLPVIAERRSAKEVSRRVKATNFEEFEPLFKQMHADLASGEFVIRDFAGEDTIKEGQFFILAGVMLFVAEVGEDEIVASGSTTKKKQRLRVIFENGTEGSMYRQSLSIRFYLQDGRSIVRSGFDASEIGDADVESGHVYVLRSLSEDPQISSIENLYKIGFSRNPVKKRIANAEKDPTYLMAPVHIEEDYRVYNLRPSSLENLLHRVFGSVRLNVSQVGIDGRTYNPHEWFVAPLPVINQAIKMIMTGDIVNVVYDPAQEQLVPRED